MYVGGAYKLYRGPVAVVVVVVVVVVGQLFEAGASDMSLDRVVHRLQAFSGFGDDFENNINKKTNFWKVRQEFQFQTYKGKTFMMNFAAFKFRLDLQLVSPG